MGKIICGDAVTVLAEFPENHFDLTVFSPPYDGLRDYNGFDCDLHALGAALLRVTKEGGVAAMVIQDQTNNGTKTLTSFRTIVDWCDNIGWGLFETCIYRKNGKDGAWWKRRFRVDHEYIPIFVKGKRPKFFDKEAVKIPCKHAGKEMTGAANRDKNGVTQVSRKMTINPTKCPGTIWDYGNGGDKVAMKRQHPAPFPDKIPADVISVFTEPGDLVRDPMVGSGSTAIAAHYAGRDYVGIDVSEEYCDLAKRRIAACQTNLDPAFRNAKASGE